MNAFLHDLVRLCAKDFVLFFSCRVSSSSLLPFFRICFFDVPLFCFAASSVPVHLSTYIYIYISLFSLQSRRVLLEHSLFLLACFLCSDGADASNNSVRALLLGRPPQARAPCPFPSDLLPLMEAPVAERPELFRKKLAVRFVMGPAPSCLSLSPCSFSVGSLFPWLTLSVLFLFGRHSFSLCHYL